MIARLLQVDVPPERVEVVLDAYRQLVRPIHVAAGGLRHHFVLADRTSGKVVILGVWESAAAMDEMAAELEPARAALWETIGATPGIERLEVLDEIARDGT